MFEKQTIVDRIVTTYQTAQEAAQLPA